MEVHIGIAEAAVLNRSPRGQQDSKEGCKLIPSYKNTNITTNSWTTTNKKKSWNLPKKIPCTQRQRRSHNSKVWGHNHNQIKLHSHWMDDKPANNSDRSESPELNIWLPSLGVWKWEEEPPENLAFKASRVWSQEFYRIVGNRNCTFGGYTQALVHSGTQGKKVVTS